MLHRGEPAERRPRLPGRRLALALGALATGLAALVGNLSSYQSFLLLLGALFVPLFGVLAADWFVLTRRRYDIAGMYRPDGPYRGVRWPAVGVWLAGFLVYNWINPGTVRPCVAQPRAVLRPAAPALSPIDPLPLAGASLPTFAVAFLAMLAAGQRPHPRPPAARG